MLCSADYRDSQLLCCFGPWYSESHGFARAVRIEGEFEAGGTGCMVFGIEIGFGGNSQFTCNELGIEMG